jgi:hypothetical protein
VSRTVLGPGGMRHLLAQLEAFRTYIHTLATTLDSIGR